MNTMLRLSIFFWLWAAAMLMRADGIGETIVSDSDSALVERLLATAPKDAGTLWFARQFLGCPYVAHTLERGAFEPLVVNLHEFDCTTLVETVCALRLCRQRDLATFADYKAMLTRLRYFGGVRNGYLSRHHYFHWWALDNEARHLVTSVADKALCTAVLRIDNHYMSVHPQSYAMLRDDPVAVDSIRRLERRYNGAAVPYVPQQKIRQSRRALSSIEDGDIIAVVTSRDGLDYAHLGFAFYDRYGRLHMLHASSQQKRVVADSSTLFNYLHKRPSFLGIKVFRLNPDF